MCHVLIIEDEPTIAMLLQDLLEEAGATSFAIAATEQDAVSLALQQHPSVITSDMRLLKGTGPSAVERIIQQIGKIPFIFISADPDMYSWSSPPTAVLAKPFSSYEALTVFHDVVQPQILLSSNRKWKSCSSKDDSQQVVKVVRDAAGKLTNRLQLL